MSQVSVNPGPIATENTMTLNNQLGLLQNIWLELKIISALLKQIGNISDSDAAIRNSQTVNDLTQLS